MLPGLAWADLGLPAVQVTVSTVGLVPEMEHFVGRCTAQLAVSLHATTDEVRAAQKRAGSAGVGLCGRAPTSHKALTVQ